MNNRLDTALSHVSTIYGLYVGQRQNLVNYYLAGISLLSIAYAAAIDKHRAPVAVAVCALGVLASASSYLQDQRLRTLMDETEKPLLKLQERLAGELQLESLKIQKAINDSKEAGPSRGQQIRIVYGAVAVVFLLGAIYAALSR